VIAIIDRLATFLRSQTQAVVVLGIQELPRMASVSASRRSMPCFFVA
jgi:hypothetical protein